jgi:glycosyltransferase involved in cell wall biosynthesis
MSSRRWRVLHAIHDFLPRHRAGSEIYAFNLCRALAGRHDVTVVAAEFDPLRDHGEVAWRVQDGIPVVEIVNNWDAKTFQDTYRSGVITDRLRHVLRAIRPDVVHVHSLLNLSFDLPAAARRGGAAVVATLHDYTLVCPSGGQRLHQKEAHLCASIDVDRCARCFGESPFHAQMSFAALKAAVPLPGTFSRAAVALRRRFPQLAARAAGAAMASAAVPVSPAEIAVRLSAARDVFESVDLAVAPSASLAAEFASLGFPSSRIHVSDYGFEPMAPARRTAAGPPLRIGYVGSIVWHKGLHVLIDAVGRLPRTGWTLTTWGDENVSPEYSAELHRRAGDVPVRFAGGFSAGGAASAMADLDVLVVPSIWLENSPLVIHEAFMAGVYVVGANTGGIPGLLGGGRHGRLYDANSPEALAVVLGDLVRDPDRVRQMGAAAPPVKSIDDDAREWEARYEDVIARVRAGASP